MIVYSNLTLNSWDVVRMGNEAGDKDIISSSLVIYSVSCQADVRLLVMCS